MIFGMSGAVIPATVRNIQEDLYLQHHRWDNFKSRNNIATPLTLMFEIFIFIAINSYARWL